jgi:hypothetical protein
VYFCANLKDDHVDRQPLGFYHRINVDSRPVDHAVGVLDNTLTPRRRGGRKLVSLKSFPTPRRGTSVYRFDRRGESRKIEPVQFPCSSVEGW